MPTWHPGSALLAAAAIPHKGIEVIHFPDVSHMARVIGTHHWQALADGITTLQHVQHL